ncbi:protein of unknown function [Paraburkholderia dioscoreae]|uniref:Uncharacterized protein n=1 Tax=Paraburkholderia dioscoreae TaxID=2604047 RepID=A0A5Q4ZKX2_9BURK|nr:protein of unknown function [Paraburkholderia dioscoreae]
MKTVQPSQNKNGAVISHNAVHKTLPLEFFGVADGARTHDNRNHNPVYPYSYHKGVRGVMPMNGTQVVS